MGGGGGGGGGEWRWASCFARTEECTPSSEGKHLDAPLRFLAAVESVKFEEHLNMFHFHCKPARPDSPLQARSSSRSAQVARINRGFAPCKVHYLQRQKPPSVDVKNVDQEKSDVSGDEELKSTTSHETPWKPSRT